jgi:hypothetical protein
VAMLLVAWVALYIPSTPLFVAVASASRAWSAWVIPRSPAVFFARYGNPIRHAPNPRRGATFRLEGSFDGSGMGADGVN